jgi:hypothetical protein
VRVRNLKLFVQDVFKQFDLLFKEIDLREQHDSLARDGKVQAEASASQVGINLGELQPDSVKAFTDLLYMPQIDKKLITALGDFMYRISTSGQAKTQGRSQRNWSLIHEQLGKIAGGNLRELNDSLLNTLITLQSFGVTLANTSLQRSLSQLERANSQVSNGDQVMQAEHHPELQPTRQVSSLGPAASTFELSKEQEEQLKDQLTQLRHDSGPLCHVFTLFTFFYSSVSTALEAAARVGEQQEQRLKELRDKLEVLSKEERTADVDAQITTLTEELDKLEGEAKAGKEQALQQKQGFIEDIKVFFSNEQIGLFVQQNSQLLATMQKNSFEMMDITRASSTTSSTASCPRCKRR